MNDRLLRFASLALLAATTAACSSETSASSADTGGAQAPASQQQQPSGGQDTSAEAQRAITEADIIQVDDQLGRLYAMSKSGTLAVVDVSRPAHLALLGKTRLPGEPFEMYRRGDTVLAMTNGAFDAYGAQESYSVDDTTTPARDLSSGAIVIALDVSSPSAMKTVESYKVSGQIADSRLVGDVLYLATYETGTCYSCKSGARTLVTSFDVSSNTIAPVDQVSFSSPQSTTFSAAWSTPWKRSIVVTNERIYVGGLASSTSTAAEGVLEVLDISDPHGTIVKGASIPTAGPIMSRWQADEYQGVLRVISERGAGATQNGSAYPEIQTFRVTDANTITPLATTTLSLPRQEGLKTVRFDGQRAYAITFNQTDPLFTLDLSDPAHPAQKGELKVPGWTFYLVPRGDYLLGLGLDRTDHTGNLNVSLYDVHDMANPQTLQRVSFGPTNLYEDYQITTAVMAEDQDRIQKAFYIGDDGLLAVPYSGTSACGGGSGVQLIDWQSDTLTKRTVLPVAGNPRRAFRRNGEMITVSDSNVTSFTLSNAPTKSADVVIGTCIQRTTPYGSPANGGGYYGDDYEYNRPLACSMHAPARSSSFAGLGILTGLALAFAARRRARQASSR